MAPVARQLPRPGRRVLDVGAGTGLLGVALAAAGFHGWTASTSPAAMLEEAARKGVYQDLREGTLGEAARVRVGERTTASCRPASSRPVTPRHVPRRARPHTRRGGHVVFTLRSDTALPGFDDKIAELERARRWELVDKGDEFQALPKGEPEVLVRVWAFRVLEPELA